MDAAQEAPVKKLRMTIRKQLEIAQAEKAALETTLRDTTSALQESIDREQKMVGHLNSRFGREVGEHPVDYVKRVVGFLSDQATSNERARQESLRIQQGQKAEIQLLNGQLNSLEGVLTGAVQMAKAGKPPAPPDVLVDPRLSDKMERILRIVERSPTGRDAAAYPFGIGFGRGY